MRSSFFEADVGLYPARSTLHAGALLGGVGLGQDKSGCGQRQGLALVGNVRADLLAPLGKGAPTFVIVKENHFEEATLWQFLATHTRLHLG